MNSFDTNSDSVIEIFVAGRQWHLLRPADLESLWEQMTDDQYADDERLPYWVELWPSTIALASWLENCRERIKGEVCLDLGCGLGLSALVGQLLGARVIGVDYEFAALQYASRNAAHNGVASPLWVGMDWRYPAVQREKCSFIWGGDIMYERRFVLPVLDFMEYALHPSGVMWIAEPDRAVYSFFRQALELRGWSSHRVFQKKVVPLHEQKSLVTVNLWEISKKDQ